LGGKIILAHTIAAQQILETKIWHTAFYFIFLSLKKIWQKEK
jgi:hypothetical protein